MQDSFKNCFVGLQRDWVRCSNVATSNSVAIEFSPKLQLQLPTKRPVVAEPKAISRSREWFITDDYSPSIFQKVITELVGTHVGTYFLIFVGCGAPLTDQAQKLTIVGRAIVWSVVVLSEIYAIGHISGAHFNPAVSIALASAGKFSWKNVPAYVLAQVLGATLASLTLKVLFKDQDDVQLTMTRYKESTSDLEAIIWEFIITFFLMFNICSVATDHRASKDFAGVAIGGTLLFNVMLAGPITGASMNPARSLGPAIVSGVYKNLWIYIVSRILGALAGTLAYSMLWVSNPEKPEEKTKNIFNHLYLNADP